VRLLAGAELARHGDAARLFLNLNAPGDYAAGTGERPR